VIHLFAFFAEYFDIAVPETTTLSVGIHLKMRLEWALEETQDKIEDGASKAVLDNLKEVVEKFEALNEEIDEAFLAYSDYVGGNQGLKDVVENTQGWFKKSEST